MTQTTHILQARDDVPRLAALRDLFFVHFDFVEQFHMLSILLKRLDGRQYP